jgi:hypothetical protein
MLGVISEDHQQFPSFEHSNSTQKLLQNKIVTGEMSSVASMPNLNSQFQMQFGNLNAKRPDIFSGETSRVKKMKQAAHRLRLNQLSTVED